MPESPEEVQELVRLCKKEEMPFYVIGNGSNLLVSDQGYRGVILQIYRNMSQIRVGRKCAPGAGGSPAVGYRGQSL